MNSLEYYDSPRRDMLPFVPASKSRVLEVGCGTGRFISGLSGGVTERWGVEANEAVCAVARESGLRMLQGLYESVEDKIPSRYFDLVIANDAMEHMVDHDGFLESIAKKLAPHGTILLSVPNVGCIRNIFNLVVRRDWKYEDSGTLDRTHLRFFTRKSLMRTLKQHGFEDIRITGINSNMRSGLVGILCWVLVVGASFGFFADTQYLQFAVTARLSTEPN